MLARSVALNAAGQVGRFTVSFAAAVLLARLLGPGDRGLLAVMITVATLAVAVAGAGIGTSVQYFASRRQTAQSALLGNSLLCGLVLALVFVPVFWALRGVLGDTFASGHGGLVWVLAATLVPLTFLDWTITGQLCGRLQFGLWNGLLVCSRVVTLIAVAVLVGVAGLQITGAVLATAAGALFIVAASTWALLRDGRPRLSLSLFISEVRYGAKAQIGQLLQAVNYRFDLLILSLMVPLAGVGYYVVAQTLAELIIYVGAAFEVSILPLISRLEGDERQSETTQVAVRHHGIITLAVVAINALLAPLALIFGYGAAFAPALVPLLILLPGMWFLGTGNMIAGDLRGRGRPGLGSVLHGSAAVVTVVLDVTLIPRYGLNGAAIASCIAYTFYGLISLFALSRVASVPVRRLVVPTHADLVAYPRALRTAVRRVRGRGQNALASEPVHA